jgi:hypothetical protein
MNKRDLQWAYEPDDYEPERWELPALTPQRVAEVAFVGLVALSTARWIYNKLGWDFGQSKES